MFGGNNCRQCHRSPSPNYPAVWEGSRASRTPTPPIQPDSSAKNLFRVSEAPLAEHIRPTARRHRPHPQTYRRADAVIMQENSASLSLCHSAAEPCLVRPIRRPVGGGFYRREAEELRCGGQKYQITIGFGVFESRSQGSEARSQGLETPIQPTTLEAGRPTRFLRYRAYKQAYVPHRREFKTVARSISTVEWGQENPGIHSFVPILLSIGSCFADSALEASKPRKGGRP